jgi:hypothetical protein
MRSVLDYEGHYSVTEDGKVWSHKSNKFLKPILCNNYFSVNLCKPGKKIKLKRVHRIVAEAYLENPENKPQINHIDANKLNNAVSNLEWVTVSENIRHAHNLGIYKNAILRANAASQKVRSANKKLPDIVVKMLRDIYRITGKSTAKLARAYGVSQATMYNAIMGIRAYKGV